MAKRSEKYTAEYIDEKVTEYLKTHRGLEEDGSDIPILKECCLENGWSYEYIDNLRRRDEAVGGSIKRLIDTKEVILEHKLYTGKNQTGYIFSLKQQGWKDNPQVVNEVKSQVKVGNRVAKLSLEQKAKIHDIVHGTD